MKKTDLSSGWLIGVCLLLFAMAGCKIVTEKVAQSIVEKNERDEPSAPSSPRHDFSRPSPTDESATASVAENRRVEFYVVSYCGWCKKAQDWLDDHGVEYETIMVDELSEADQDDAKERMLQFTDGIGFPLLVIDDGDQVIQGYDPGRMQEVFK